MDVSGVVPEARGIVHHAAEAYLRHTRPWFVGLVAHGSAVKGGFVPGSSDVDLRIYLKEQAFTDGKIPLATATAIQCDLAHIDPAPFRYVQGYAVPARPPPDFVGPIPGSYAPVCGEMPVGEATSPQLEAGARTSLENLDPYPAFVADGLLEHGGMRLSSNVRLLCTKVWPTLYHLLILRGQEPVEAWNVPKDAAVQLLPGEEAGREIRAFYRAVLSHYPEEASVGGAIAVIEAGVEFLRAAKIRFEERTDAKR